MISSLLAAGGQVVVHREGLEQGLRVLPRPRASHAARRALFRLPTPVSNRYTVASASREESGDPAAQLAWKARLQRLSKQGSTAQEALDGYLDLLAVKDAETLGLFKEPKFLPQPLVVALQDRLKLMGLLNDKSDGLWGANTQAAFDKASLSKLRSSRPKPPEPESETANE